MMWLAVQWWDTFRVWLELAAAPVAAWLCHGAALARARRRRQKCDNRGLSPKSTGARGRYDAA